jgi:predicted ATPase
VNSGPHIASQSDPLQAMLNAGGFEPYIRYIRFPHFRNLRDGTRINFTYPITALVGPNGTNKTAILRAIQGCPDQTNIGLYWFSTSLDPIKPEDRHRFIHGYKAKSTGQIVEAIKTRIARVDPDYFEPARPILADGMTRMPPAKNPMPPERVRTRWKAIRKAVVYLDFRSELSAFDKYFFHTPFTTRTSTLVEKKRFIRRRTNPLRISLDGRASYEYQRRERVIEAAKELTDEQVVRVSEILGRKYQAITIIRHSFFNGDGYSVVLRESHLSYSEAFAGSGEFAVTMLVFGVTEADEYSLILLDEPEVSLHPGAQHNLMEFIKSQAKDRRHQFVISTHSPEIVRGLPDNALKVFQSHPTDGKIDLLSQDSSPAEAFFRLGVPTIETHPIYVEDGLAAEIVRRAIRLPELGEAAHAQLKIEALPGGAGAIQTRLIPAFALSQIDCLVFLDGDQRNDSIPTSDQIPDSELLATAQSILNGNPQLSLSGGATGHSEIEKNQQLRIIIEWARTHVAYLPGEDPESLLLKLVDGSESPEGVQGSKHAWESRTRSALGRGQYERVSASDILSEQERALAKVSDESPDLIEIAERVKLFLSQG